MPKPEATTIAQAKLAPRGRKVKILATVGPASRDPEMLSRLFRAGADAFRVNMSHGEHADHARVLGIDVREEQERPGSKSRCNCGEMWERPDGEVEDGQLAAGIGESRWTALAGWRKRRRGLMNRRSGSSRLKPALL